jgi:hypothetical protein
VGFSGAVKGAGNAVFSCSACASDAMGVYFWVVGNVEVDDHI